MSRSTISTFDLFAMFPDAESARLYLESRLWANGATCPICKSIDRITTRKGGYYRCNACQLDFTIRTGTIFERSHIPLNKWLYAMYMLVTARKGISSMQLAKEIGVTQKSAWFMLHRLREACNGKLEKLQGMIGVDRMSNPSKPPKALDSIADVVLAYRPKDREPEAKPRKKANRSKKKPKS